MQFFSDEINIISLIFVVLSDIYSVIIAQYRDYHAREKGFFRKTLNFLARMLFLIMLINLSSVIYLKKTNDLFHAIIALGVILGIILSFYFGNYSLTVICYNCAKNNKRFPFNNSSAENTCVLCQRNI